MRKSTCLLPKVSFFAALTLALLVGHVRSGVAQETGGVVPASYQSGGFFNQSLGTALRFNYHTRGYGTQDDVVSLGGMKVFNMDNATMFVDGQGTLSDDFGGGFNLGVGYRQLTTTGMSFDPQRILGVGFWTDGQSTSADNFFSQLGFSLESLGESFDLRLNGHFPLERTQTSDPTLTSVGTPLFAGSNLFNATERVTIDTAHSVVDGEFAKRINDLDAWAFVGGYQLGGGGVDATGYRAGVRGYAVPDVALSLQVTDDDVYATNVMFGITWFIGRTNKCNGPCGTIMDRFREPVLRNDFIATTSRQETRASGDAAIDPDTGLAKNFVFVNSNAGAGGDGSFENPFDNLTAAEGILANNDTVFAFSNSTFTDSLNLMGANPMVTPVTDADFIGEGNDIVHVCQTDNFGVVTLPESSAGAQSGTVPILNLAGGTAFTAGDNSEINNAIINGADIGVLADGVVAPHLANLTINTSVDGVRLLNTTGSTIVENTVEINGATGIALLVDGGDAGAELGATINDTTGMSLVVQNKTGGTVNYTGTIDDDTDDSGGDFSDGVLIDMNVNTTVNLTAASTLDISVDDGETAIQVTNNTSTDAATPAIVDAQGTMNLIATGTGQGLAISDNDATSQITFANLDATAVDGNTVSVADEGTVIISSADDTRTIENTGTGSALVSTGDSVLTVNSNIENSVGGRAVDLQNRTANDVLVFGNVTDSAAGIHIENNSAGQMTFTGEVRLTSTGANNALTMLNNEGAEVSFTDIQASAVNGNTVDVTGGGTLTITDTNTTNTIDNTGTGTAVRIEGNANGDAIVTIDAPVTNSIGGRSIDILNRTSNNVTFNGTVDDTGDGLRIFNNSVGGTIDFTQAVTSNVAGVNHAIDLDTNTDTTIMFNGVSATTTGTGTAFRGVGGGTLLVASPNTPGDNTIDTQDGIGLDLQGMTIDPGNVTFEIFNVNGANVAAMGINLQNLDGTGQVVIGGTDATQGGSIGSAGTAINIDDVANVSITQLAVANNVAGNTGAGVVVTNQVAGSVVSLTDMDLNTRDAAAVDINGNTAGVVTFNTLAATTGGTGDGINIDNTDASTVGINLSNVTVDAQGTGRGFAATGGGTISMTGTNTIDSAGATAFEVDDVENLTASNVTIANTTQRGVVVTGQDTAGDNVTLTNFDVTTTTADAVRVATNTDGTVNLNTLTAQSSSGGTVVIDDNGAGTVNINGMDATATSSGTAFSATGGGTLSAAGTNNVTANTGQGVNIDSMTIAAGGATFADVDVTAGTTTGVNLSNNTGGTITVNGGTMTTAGTALNVLDSDSVAINNVNVTNTVGAGLVASNSAGDSLSMSNVDIETSTGVGVDVDGGTFAATGTNTIMTTTGTGLDINATTIGATGASFTSVDVAGATNGIVLTDLSGGQVRVGAAAATGTAGAGGTLTTTGTAILVTGVTDAVFNDVTTSTGGAFDGVTVEHTTAAASSVLFNNLTHTSTGTGDGIVVTDSDSGELDFTLRNSNVDVAAANSIGFNLITGNNPGEIDIRLDNNVILAGNNSAVLADLNAGTGDVQFLVNGGNNWSNTSAASATASFLVSAGRTLNATIGDQDGTAPFDENVFANGNGAGTAFAMESNDAAATVSLDLRGNNASGGGTDYLLTETLGTFGIVDLTETVTNGTNNAGTVSLGGGGVEADFDDLVPPIKQVD